MGPFEVLRRMGVERLTIDSRAVGEGTAFVALPPATPESRDGRDFACAAIRDGAPVVLGQGVAPEGLAADQWISLNDVRQDYPSLAKKLAGNSAVQLRVFGVTGTDGKTSVAWLASELLNALEAGTCARLGTLGVQWAGVDERPGYTTPPASVLHPLMARMADDGTKRLVMEVSSHAIALGRVAAVDFSAGMLTTLARDHLDFHGDVTSYHRTKLAWLDSLSKDAVVIAPDRLSGRMAARPGVRFVGTDGLSLESVGRRDGWTLFEATKGAQRLTGRTLLIGRLMLENLALAFELALSEGFDLETVVAAAELIKPVPGRFEPIGDRALVDYAHTPDALKQALQALREQCSGRLIVVFGAGGERDRGKRPEMACAVEQAADLAVVTTDNPRSEDPGRIIADIVRGFERPEREAAELSQTRSGWARVVDRKAAIELAWSLCGPDDLLFVAGKGAEQTQEVCGEYLPFDDRHELRRLMGA